MDWIASRCVDVKSVRTMWNTKKCFMKVKLEMMTNFVNELAIAQVHLSMYILENLVVLASIWVLKIAARLQLCQNKSNLASKYSQWKSMNCPVLLWPISSIVINFAQALDKSDGIFLSSEFLNITVDAWHLFEFWVVKYYCFFKNLHRSY